MLYCCAGSAQVSKGCRCLMDAASNHNDIEIVNSICGTIVAVVAILAACFLLWKLIDHIAKGWQRCRQHTWENEDKKATAEAEKLARQNQLEDKERKQQESLLEKRLAILKELCYNNDGRELSVKKYDSTEIKDYLEELDRQIKHPQNTENNED